MEMFKVYCFNNQDCIQNTVSHLYLAEPLRVTTKLSKSAFAV